MSCCRWHFYQGCCNAPLGEKDVRNLRSTESSAFCNRFFLRGLHNEMCLVSRWEQTRLWQEKRRVTGHLPDEGDPAGNTADARGPHQVHHAVGGFGGGELSLHAGGQHLKEMVQVWVPRGKATTPIGDVRAAPRLLPTGYLHTELLPFFLPPVEPGRRLQASHRPLRLP